MTLASRVLSEFPSASMTLRMHSNQEPIVFVTLTLFYQISSFSKPIAITFDSFIASSACIHKIMEHPDDVTSGLAEIA